MDVLLAQLFSVVCQSTRVYIAREGMVRYNVKLRNINTLIIILTLNLNKNIPLYFD